MNSLTAVRACVAALGIACYSPAAQTAETATTTLFFISDLHLGVGKDGTSGTWSPYEDFRWHKEFVAFLDGIGQQTKDRAQLIVLGDFVELWQTADMSCTGEGATLRCRVNDCASAKPAVGCTDKEVVRRLNRVLAQHADTLAAIGQFASRGTNNVVIVPGNHDAGLLLPEATEELLKAIGAAPGRVKFSTSGYWLSADGKIYADHGHQFDRVNLYRTWPTPFEASAGVRAMERPWGELMVQQFFNEYERQFPTIDNLAEESAGMKYGIAALHARGVTVGVGRFLSFLVADTSLTQKGDFLGEAKEGQPAEWDIDAVKKDKGTEFLVSTLAVDDPSYEATQAEFVRGEITTRPADLDDEELQAVCDTRVLLAEEYRRSGRNIAVDQCPTKTPGSTQKLGYVVNKMIGAQRAAMTAHLRKTAAAIAATGTRPAIDIYIYGHTHSAKGPERIKVDTGWHTVVANTGAFQRLASNSYLKKLKAERGWKDADVMPSMKVEDLQPCYSYVRVDAYAQSAEPKPALMYWTQAKEGWTSKKACN